MSLIPANKELNAAETSNQVVATYETTAQNGKKKKVNVLDESTFLTVSTILLKYFECEEQINKLRVTI